VIKLAKEIKKELTKVKFPTKKEITQSFLMVVAFLFIAGVFLSIVDYVLSLISLLF
jgi:preprotein translocase SecE subunit